MPHEPDPKKYQVHTTKGDGATPDPDMVQDEKCRYVYVAIMETGQIYTYLMGGLPTTSHSGNTYILVLYDYNGNIFLSAPMKKRGDKEMVRAFDLLIQSLIMCGLRPPPATPGQ
jgi:hypothetical protein